MSEKDKPAPAQHADISQAPAPINPVRAGRTPSYTLKTPVWREWRMTPYVKLQEAVALSMNIDPHSLVYRDFDGRMYLPNTGQSAILDEFKLRHRLLTKNLSDACLCADVMGQVKLSAFAHWALAVAKLDNLPPELVEMAQTCSTGASLSQPTKAALAECNPMIEAKAEQTRPPQQQRFQETEILRVITELGFTAKALPKNKPGKSGVKTQVRSKLRFSISVFDKAWERLSANKEIAYRT